MVRMDPREFADLAQELNHGGDLRQTARQVLDHACTALGAPHGGITLIKRDGHLETIAFSDELVRKADLLQYELRQGPCRDASWHGSILASEDLAADSRWPQWSPRVVELGVGGVLATELNAADNGQRLGAVNLYWSEPVTFTADDLAYASIFGVHAAVALSASLEASQLNTALDARKVIGQAQGILMERYDLPPEQAFEVLRRYSQNHNVKLRQVAEQLVATRRLPSAPPASGQRHPLDT